MIFMILSRTFIFITVIFTIFVLFVSNLFVNANLQSVLLDKLWLDYKARYIDVVSGRVIDEQSNGVTTSEGQSYAMLRSVWSNDKETFNKTWDWTRNNLQKPSSNSFSWLWGLNPDGQFKIISEAGGETVASDADFDIAYALILASKKWSSSEFSDIAIGIVNDIWKELIIEGPNGKLIIAANDKEKKFQKNVILFNPSYFNPVAIKEFAKLDKEHNWEKVLSDGYDLVKRSTVDSLDQESSASLPPDWVEYDILKDTISASVIAGLTTNFGYDAGRLLWRLGLDYKLNKNPLAYEYLKTLSFFNREFVNKNLIFTVYSHSGNVISNYESIFMYSNVLAYFEIFDSEVANKIKQNFLETDGVKYGYMSYYDSNWLWFSLALNYDYLT
jgi:endoglucanase